MQHPADGDTPTTGGGHPATQGPGPSRLGYQLYPAAWHLLPRPGKLHKTAQPPAYQHAVGMSEHGAPPRACAARCSHECSAYPAFRHLYAAAQPLWNTEWQSASECCRSQQRCSRSAGGIGVGGCGRCPGLTGCVTASGDAFESGEMRMRSSKESGCWYQAHLQLLPARPTRCASLSFPSGFLVITDFFWG